MVSTTYIILDIMIHICILFTFLSIFFFAYVSKIERDTFQKEIGRNLENSMTQILNKNREYVLPTIDKFRPNLVQWQNMYSSPLSYSAEKNKLVKATSLFIILLLLCSILSIVITLKFDCGKESGIWNIVIEKSIAFIIIGIVELWFFNNVALKYIPTTPSLLVKTMIEMARHELNPQ